MSISEFTVVMGAENKPVATRAGPDIMSEFTNLVPKPKPLSKISSKMPTVFRMAKFSGTNVNIFTTEETIPLSIAFSNFISDQSHLFDINC